LNQSQQTQRPSWRARITIAAATSILFLILYSGTAYLTDLRSDVGTWYYDWERFIPFVPEMIVPYMSIDLFFVLAPLICRDRRELSVLAWRLSAVLVLATLFFLIYPLRLAVDRPYAEGFFGEIYNWFTSMDHRPYNLCPSMHIALRTVLAAHYGKHCQGWLRGLMNGWFFLIGCSTLLLYQHHVIDVVGGFVLALLVMYVWDGLPWRLPKVGGGRFAGMYAGAAFGLVAVVWVQPKMGWLTLWPAVACGWVAFGYAWAGPAVYRREGGQLTWPARFVLGPVLAAQWLSWWYYAGQANQVDEVQDGVMIGRHLRGDEAQAVVDSGLQAVVDVCNAFSEPAALLSVAHLPLPILDLTAPSREQLQQATAFIAAHQPQGPVLVHCKAGYSRSAAIVAAWLLESGRAKSVDDAINLMRRARPSIVIRPEIREALEQWQCRLTQSSVRES
jgi:membrane-associated phospholipid phosphatase/protein tyrosine phosphatase (PTP) superfamily phosphohydrolase (DUF442 family)